MSWQTATRLYSCRGLTKLVGGKDRMAEKTNVERVRRCYQVAVTSAGLSLCALAGANVALFFETKDQLIILALIILAILVGAFPQNFRIPVGLGFTREVITFTLTDAIVILVACCCGVYPAILIAGIESFVSSRRGGPLLSSHLFSSAMMSLSAAAASVVLLSGLYAFSGQTGIGVNHNLAAVAPSLFLASIAQFTVNAILLSTLIGLRHRRSILHSWKDFLWTAPMYLPTGTAATLIYAALRVDLFVMVAIGGPTLLTIFFAHRQYRDNINKRIAVMDKAHRETIEALAVAINAKDEVTHGHVLRVQIYAARVGQILGCSEAEIEALKAGALLHDIGKIAVPDYILNKPAKLTAAEFEKMKYHTIAGAQILSRVEFPYPIVPVARSHHERWDGKGYPDSLKGEEIPLTARILSVVDCFDAVREDRQYRKGLTREQAIDLLITGSGSQYDPNVVGKFISHLSEFEEEIASHRGDPIPTFGIEPSEKLSEVALKVPPAAGLALEESQPSQREGPRDATAALCDLAESLFVAGGEQEVLSALTEKLSVLVPYDLCAVTLVTPGKGDNRVVHARGNQGHLIEGRSWDLGEGVIGWVILNGQPVCNVDPNLDFPGSLPVEFSSYRTLAVFPLIKNNQALGAVALYSAALNRYSAEHLRYIEQAAHLTVTVLSTTSKHRNADVITETDDNDFPSQVEIISNVLN
jgi:putative nucleotidyltransferase with HDIG domain